MYDLMIENLESSSVDVFKDTQVDEYYADITKTGKQISADALAENPYPGLRPFKTSENIVFMGREEISTDLVKRLATNRFLAVLGASGTGKSSLVRAGLLPALSVLPGRHGIWKIAIFRPGKNPFGNLVQALSNANVFPSHTDKQLLETLSTSSFGFAKVCQSEPNYELHNTLIIVDQFEELFRYRKDKGVAGRNEAALFAKMLIDITSNEKLNAYVMITMRSEFLGDCVQLAGLPEAINNGQYLVPRLRQDQLIDAVTEPALFAGATIEPGFAEKLVGEIGDDMDQLPVLQHALRRSYQAAKDEAKLSGRESDVFLSYKHYCAIGKMDSAIDQHADEIYKTLSEKEQEYCKVIFQSVTDKATDGRGIRRPLPLYTIVEICQETISDENETETRQYVEKVINAFRKDKVNFLLPSLLDEKLAQALNTEAEIGDNIEIDISHESIMRVWKQLSKWMEEEAKLADLLKYLLNRDPTDYFKGAMLTVYEKWLALKENALTWAHLYRPGYIEEKDFPEKFKAGIRLIKKSLQKQKEREVERQNKRRQEQIDRERELKSKRNKLITRISIAAAIISILFGAIAYTQTKKANIAIQQKADADRIAAEANAQKKIDSAKVQADARRKIDSAATQAKLQRTLVFERARAEAQKKIDFAKAQAEAQKKIDSANAQAEALRKIDSANVQAQALFYKQSHEILKLVNEPFYKSGLIDSVTRDIYVDSLVSLTYRYHQKQQYENLLNGLNTTVDIYYTAQQNPNKGLLKAKQFDSLSRNALSDSMLLYVANNFFFYKPDTILQKQYTDYYNNMSLSAISQSRTLYAIKLGDSIKIFRYNGDSLLFLNSIILNTTRLSGKKNNDYNEANGPNAMTFVGEDSLFAFIHSKIYKMNIKQHHAAGIALVSLNKKNSNERYYTSTISPDGKKLAVDYRNYNVKIWDIDKTFDTAKIYLDPIYGYVDDISFSNNNKTAIIKQRYNKCTIVNTANFKNAEFLNKKSYLYATFTPDNKYVIVQLRDGNFELHDLEKDSSISSIKIDTFRNSMVTSVVLTPDWKKLYIKAIKIKDNQNAINTYYFQRNDSKPIFPLERENVSKDSVSGSLIKVNYLNNADILYNNNNVISLNSGYNVYTKLYNDSIKIWRKPDSVKTFAQINSLVNEIAAITVKPENTSVNVDTITNKEQLIEEANIALQRDAQYLQKQTLYDAKKIYGRLAQLDTAYLYEYRKLSRNYHTYYADTAERIKDLKKITASEEMLLKLNPADSLKQNMSSDYWNLSWYLLFEKNLDATAVIHAALRGLQLYDKNNGINTNLALGYLLSGQCEKADSVYKRFKDKPYLSDARKFRESFLQDLEDLEDAGIITPDKKNVYAQVQKVRDFLTGKTSDLSCINQGNK